MNDSVTYRRLALKAFFDFSGAIAIPAVLAALLGKWLDDKYGTEPKYLIISLFVAFLFTGIALYRKAKEYGAEYDKINSQIDENASE